MKTTISSHSLQCELQCFDSFVFVMILKKIYFVDFIFNIRVTKNLAS